MEALNPLRTVVETAFRCVARIPARSWSGRPWSTVLTYTGDGHLVWLGLKTPAGPAGGGADVAVVAAAVGHGAVSLAVTEMVAGAARRPVGTLRWDAVRQRGTPVSIDPVLNSVVGLRSVRLLSGLREWAYTGSRQGAVPPGAGLAIDPRAAGTSR